MLSLSIGLGLGSAVGVVADEENLADGLLDSATGWSFTGASADFATPVAGSAVLEKTETGNYRRMSYILGGLTDGVTYEFSVKVTPPSGVEAYIGTVNNATPQNDSSDTSGTQQTLSLQRGIVGNTCTLDMGFFIGSGAVGQQITFSDLRVVAV